MSKKTHRGPYKSGDLIGPYNIELLRKDHKNERGEWYSWFRCPYDGKEFLSSHKHIKDGNTRSCGCIKTQDLTGQKFNHWTVLGDSGKRDANRRIYWNCICDCGNEKIYLVDTSSLKLNRSQSCGCISSRGEARIKEILFKKGINFEVQKTFEKCVNPKTNYKLKFDFYLPDYNICIEYDGIQHFEKTNWSHDNFKERQERDNIKTQYCLDNNISLIRIPYNKFDDIEEIINSFL